MYFHNLEESDYNKPLWRCMDFTKFISLIESQSLYFPNISSFEDALEGVHNALGKDDQYDITNEGKFIVTDAPSNDRHKKSSRIYKGYLNSLIEEMTNSFGVQCWRISDRENHAMWKKFLSSNEGIAIKTKIDTLKEVFPQDIFHIGKVSIY